MTAIHQSPPNLVPTISSGALPQTPAEEWADSLQDTLDSHVTRTPVGTPGPKVPGGWNDEVEPPTSNGQTTAPDLRTYLPAQEDVQRALASAKTYLPQGVTAYLPDADSTSSHPTLPTSNSSMSVASDAVDIGHGASVPYTEGGAEPYSTAVDLGPATGPPYTDSGVAPYGAGAGSDLGRDGTDTSSSNTASSLNVTTSALATGASSTLASASEMVKAYVPASVADYLPASNSTSTSTSTSSSAVDLGSATDAPYTDTGVEPYGAGAGAGAGAGSDLGRDSAAAREQERTPTPTRGDSTTATTGHSLSSPATSSESVPPMPALARERDDSTVAHTGHSTPPSDSPAFALDSAASAPAPAPAPAPARTSGLRPPPPAVSRLSSSASAQLVLSPGQMTPQSSTDLALAAQRGDGVLGGVVGQDGMRTPSLVSGGESGYTASTESGLVETPGSISGSASAFSPSGFTPSEEEAETSYGIGGSAALNSTRLEDNVPSGDADWRERYSSQSQSEGPRSPANSAAEAFMAEVRAGAGAGAPSTNFAGLEVGLRGGGDGADGEGAKMGSAALNSSRYEDNVPTGEEADDEGDVDSDAEGEDDDGDDGAQPADGEDQELGGKGEGVKGKKGKLIKRFKEKMRVGGA